MCAQLVGQELAPEMEGKILVDTAEYSHKMCFEGLYSLFGYVAPVIVGGNKLILILFFLIIALNLAEHSLLRTWC
jgi:hypothetical protein